MKKGIPSNLDIKTNNMEMYSRVKHVKTFRLCVIIFFSFTGLIISKEIEAQTEITKPNILFIVTDDQAAWTISSHPSSHPNAFTPELDKLAGQGALFENAFSTAAVCSPARASLISGRYASEVGFCPDGEVYLSCLDGSRPNLTAKITWVEVLRDAGYKTALFGRWHQGYQSHPHDFGYIKYIGYAEGVGGRESKSPSLIEIDGERQSFEGQYTTDVETNFAIDFIKEWQDEPWVISLHTWAPHANQGFPEDYQVPYPSLDPNTGKRNRSWLPLKDEWFEYWKDIDVTIPNPGFPNLDKPYIERMTREYLASVKGIDSNVGRILKLLEKLNLEDNTIVIFTSDHGYNMGHNGLWHKGNGWWATLDGRDPAGNYQNFLHGAGFGQRDNLYDWSLRVPAIIRWPSVIEPGITISQTVSSIDWFPTLLAMTGVPAPKDINLRGKNIVPLLEGRDPQDWNNDLFAQHRRLRTYRTQEWKFIQDFGTTNIDELYNIKKDPEEHYNLLLDNANDPKIKKIRNMMSSKLKAYMKQINDPILQD